MNDDYDISGLLSCNSFYFLRKVDQLCFATIQRNLDITCSKENRRKRMTSKFVDDGKSYQHSFDNVIRVDERGAVNIIEQISFVRLRYRNFPFCWTKSATGIFISSHYLINRRYFPIFVQI